MVDIAVFKAQAVIIADAMNIMYADTETRSPLHPLRQMNNLFLTGVKGQSFISNLEYIDQAYEGRFPSGPTAPRDTVLTPGAVAPAAIILEPNGTPTDHAYFELSGDFLVGSTGTVTVTGDVSGANAAPIGPLTEDLTAAGTAARWARFIRGIDNVTAYSQGSKVFVKPIGTNNSLIISALSVA